VAKLVKVLVPLAFIGWTLSYFGLSKTRYSEVVRQFRNDKTVFITDFLENEIDGRFDGTGIAKLCASKKWTEGLMFSCAPPAGGVGVVRNSQLHCIRLSIEIGGEFLVLVLRMQFPMPPPIPADGTAASRMVGAGPEPGIGLTSEFANDCRQRNSFCRKSFAATAGT
jgi:hypothetical protein